LGAVLIFLIERTNVFVSRAGALSQMYCSIKVNNCSFVSKSSQGIAVSSTGVLTVSNSVVESQLDTNAGHSIDINASTSGHTIVNNHLITFNSGANAINGASTGVAYSNNVYEGMTTSLVGVTQSITTTSDTRGNIYF